MTFIIAEVTLHHIWFSNWILVMLSARRGAMEIRYDETFGCNLKRCSS
uniref:Uncharacterized protein n=1 Tax=Rhizophora mucronata TaxID=61149 RepID=A0A2P2IY36_RHIMU